MSWPQALAWRLRRQFLDPIGTASAIEVVRRLCGVQAQVASSAELAIRLRSEAVDAGWLAGALERGELIRTWAMRGTLHLLAPDEAGTLLGLFAAARPWEKPAWANWFGLTPDVIDRMRHVAVEALADGPLTRDELISALTADRRLTHVETPLRESWGTAFKPMAWQGVLAFGPTRDGRPTFVRPDLASAGWAGLPDAEAVGPQAIVAYLAAYGPATVGHFRSWLDRGRIAKRLVDQWWAAATPLLAEVDLEGERAYVPAEDREALIATEPSGAVRLLGGFDGWVLGPGTDEPHVVPARRRRQVSRQSGWIAPVVVAGGVVSGTWQVDGGTLAVSWFAEAGRVPRRAVADEVDRLGAILGRELRAEIATVPA